MACSGYWLLNHVSDVIVDEQRQKGSEMDSATKKVKEDPVLKEMLRHCATETFV